MAIASSCVIGATGMISEIEKKDNNDFSDDSDSSEDKEKFYAHIRLIEKELSKNPYMYNKHIELIKALKELGELERLREARRTMQEQFPLSDELWLDWLRDEIRLVSDDVDRQRVECLFEMAVQDYSSVSVWMEYVQFSIGGMEKEGGVQHVRDVFERALAAVGLHASQGSNIWEAYREFEHALLSSQMPHPGTVATREQEEAFSSANGRIASLFKRQLVVPLIDMEDTFSEYQEWLGDSVDPKTERGYSRALDILREIMPLEDRLISADAPQLTEYNAYIDFELKQGDPARVQSVFERALIENCLVSDLWNRYAKFLDHTLKVHAVSLPTHRRAVRNCPWSGVLWGNYILASERAAQPFADVKGVMDSALSAGLSDPADYLQVWTVYVNYLRRRIDWAKDHYDELETFRMTVERAADHLHENFGVHGDPEASLRQMLASIEARHCGNMPRARELWNQVMQEGYGNQASMWLSYYRLERSFGDGKHCRRLLQRAVNSVTDWLECTTHAYLDFEREEGTLDDYDVAFARCEAQLERLNDRKVIAVERLSSSSSSVKQRRKAPQSAGKASRKTADHASDEASGSYQLECSQAGGPGQQTPLTTGPKTPLTTGPKTPLTTVPKTPLTTGPETRVCAPYKRKAECGSDPLKTPLFKAPFVPVDDLTSAAKKIKMDVERSEGVVHAVGVDGKSMSNFHDPAKDNLTVFVSNLDYSITEETLQQALITCGQVNQVRLVRNFKGMSKGFGFVEFSNPADVSVALGQDRQLLDGRPMFISRCEDRASGKRTHQFKYSTCMEKTKLFLKNLPFSSTNKDLEAIFKKHGSLKEVRIVTYRNGSSKGLAYVEYETEKMAAHAVLKTDGMQIGDHNISVVISNPPPRKMPASQQNFVPSLGGGKKETETHGKARTQLSLLPRSLQRPDGVLLHKDSPMLSELQPKHSPSMGNADFRKMLLK